MSVMRLGYVHAREASLDTAVNYYSNVLGLQEVTKQNGRHYFKCWDEYDPVSYTHLTLPTNREV